MILATIVRGRFESCGGGLIFSLNFRLGNSKTGRIENRSGQFRTAGLAETRRGQGYECNQEPHM
jgi:hypothetical protein